MNSTAGILDRVVSDLDAVLRSDRVQMLSDVQKMQVLRAAGEAARRLDAVVVETIASVDQRPSGSGEPAFCGQFGCRTISELLQRVLRTDAAGAGRVVKAARAVRREVDLCSGEMLQARWPALREALVGGAVGVSGLLAATGPIDQAGPRIGTGDRWRADAELAEYARGCVAVDAAEEGGAMDASPAATLEDLRMLSRAIVTYLDPDGAEPVEERAMRARGIILGRMRDGVIPIRGELLPETAGQLQRIFDAYLNPKVGGPPPIPAADARADGGPGVRFVASEGESTAAEPTAAEPTAAESAGAETTGGESTGGESTGVESTGDAPRGLLDDDVLPSDDAGRTVDDRSRAQKQHDALEAVLGIAARHSDMPRLGGAAPTLIVSVAADDYATGRGWAHVEGLGGGESGGGGSGGSAPVSIRAARHVACGGSIERVLFDPEGRIVGIGSSERIFTVHQRRAILLRDGECLIPGCHVSAAWCEIHHVIEHARGGSTSTDNGVALCWYHHRSLDTSGWEIRMTGGRPQIRGPEWWDPHRRWREPRPNAKSGGLTQPAVRTPIRA